MRLPDVLKAPAGTRIGLRLFSSALDGVVASLDVAAEGAGHGHSEDLNERDAKHDAAGNDHVALDLTHQRVEAALERRGGEGGKRREGGY